MRKRSYYIINGITIYRLISAPILIMLIFARQYDLFKWLLAISFFTDAIDGWLARRFKIESVLGARLDSIADDCTIVAGIIGMFVLKRAFMEKEWIMILVLLVLFVIQTSLAIIRYGKMTSFHTYAAKLAAVVQGVFLLLLFFLPQPIYALFYLTVLITGLELIEESIIILLLPRWQTNVKGLFWVMKYRRQDNIKNPL